MLHVGALDLKISFLALKVIYYWRQFHKRDSGHALALFWLKMIQCGIYKADDGTANKAYLGGFRNAYELVLQ